MTFSPATEAQTRISAEIGQMRYEAICHFLIDGDYKADHQGDFAGAFSDYANAWSMLVTERARRLSGFDILEGLADFAAKSGEPGLMEQANTLIAAYRQETSRESR